tara:strand:- start:1429 stop:1632 length:204 start_codon:yes stop_codon:yes gene_type:complete
MPAPPPPDPSIKEAQDRQEARIEAEEKETRKKMAARQRARRSGGMRLLLSKERDAPMSGLKPFQGEQ